MMKQDFIISVSNSRESAHSFLFYVPFFLNSTSSNPKPLQILPLHACFKRILTSSFGILTEISGILTEIPEILYKNPKILYKIPEISVKIPEISVKNLEISVKILEISFKIPEISVKIPKISVKYPEILNRIRFEAFQRSLLPVSFRLIKIEIGRMISLNSLLNF